MFMCSDCISNAAMTKTVLGFKIFYFITTEDVS